MIVKRILIVIVLFLILISSMEIFNLPPDEKSIIQTYKSDYFVKIDEKFEVIRDSFLGIKILTGTGEAYIFLDDLNKRNKTSVKVFDNKGRQVYAPGYKNGELNKEAYDIVNLKSHNNVFYVKDDKYVSFFPLVAEKKCLICHKSSKEGQILGIMKFSDKIDSKTFYGKERILIFVFTGIILILLLIFIIKWDTQKFIKEIFDK